MITLSHLFLFIPVRDGKGLLISRVLMCYFYSFPYVTGKWAKIPQTWQKKFLFIPVRDGKACSDSEVPPRRPFLFIPVRDGKAKKIPATIVKVISIHSRTWRESICNCNFITHGRFLFIPVRDGKGQIYATYTNIAPIYCFAIFGVCAIYIFSSCKMFDSGRLF